MKPTTTVNVRKFDYEGLVNLANRVFTSMTGNANYATPAPTLLALQTATTDVENAISVWGPVGNRGSHADLVDLRSKATTLYNLLLAEAQYVQTTAQVAAGNNYPDMAAIILTSGFAVKNPPTPQGLLGAPQNLHRMFSDSVSLYTPKLKWKKPIGLHSPNNVKSYQILRNGMNNILTAVVVGTSTKTDFIDTTAAAGQVYYYWVKGVNSEGAGAESMVLQTSTPV